MTINMIFVLFNFFCISTSAFVDSTLNARNQEYKKYFQQQEKIYQELVALEIPGARHLTIDETLAEEVLAHCPEKIKMAIFGIEQNLFFHTGKDLILHGPSATGKFSLAQAIAVKCKVPCLIFDTADISTEYMNSGVQNLNKICEYAQRLEKRLGKPCVVIFSHLEILAEKHANKNHPESNILISFAQELDVLSNSRVVVVGIMNRIEDLPYKISSRVSMIEITLPKQEHREAILSYYLKKQQNYYKLVYPAWLTADYLA